MYISNDNIGQLVILTHRQIILYPFPFQSSHNYSHFNETEQKIKSSTNIRILCNNEKKKYGHS